MNLQALRESGKATLGQVITDHDDDDDKDDDNDYEEEDDTE